MDKTTQEENVPINIMYQKPLHQNDQKKFPNSLSVYLLIFFSLAKYLHYSTIVASLFKAG